MLVAEEGALAGLYTNEATWAPLGEGAGADDAGAEPVLSAAAVQLGEYFAGTRTTFDVPLRLRGSLFQERVWTSLLEIPFGTTRTYAEQAESIGARDAVRAVGAANGQNQISIIVPCHRVVGAKGKLVGYGGGLPNKKALLVHEANVAARTHPSLALLGR